MNVTVFNKYYDKMARSESYKSTVIEATAWQEVKAVNVAKSGMQDADSVTVFIPFMQEGYKQPIPWETAPESGWTLKEGDILVKGKIDYTGASADIFTTYDNAITITSVDTYDYGSSAMQHWEVSGQ